MVRSYSCFVVKRSFPWGRQFILTTKGVEIIESVLKDARVVEGVEIAEIVRPMWEAYRKTYVHRNIICT